MNVHIVFYAYGLDEDLIRTYETATDDNFTFHLFLHSRRPNVVKAAEYLAGKTNVIYYPYGVDRGLSRSINEAISAARRMGADVFISSTDDLICQPGELKYIARTALEHPQVAYVDAMGWVERVGRRAPMEFNAAALTWHAIDTIGYFDENLFPIYFEDTDWRRRAALAGLTHLTLQDTNFVHAGSKTLLTVPEEQTLHDVTFPANRAYYEKKWGGDQGFERFSIPFNDPRYSLKIDADHVHNPYPEHRRENMAA